MKKDFNKWLSTMKDNIYTYEQYTDFLKAYSNVEKIKVELNILNSLIGSKNIKNDFIKLAQEYPNIIKVIPILIAKRQREIKIFDKKDILFNFSSPNHTIFEYAEFMEKTGIFNLIKNHIINNLVDYVVGVEVGLDSNARKNRVGKAMENIVEKYLINAGLVKNKTYFKEMYKSEIERKFKIDLSKISNNGKTEKRFDFVINYKNNIYGIECNFYNSSGSKLNETARSYKNLSIESKDIQGFHFVWLTDGSGWKSAKHNLEETSEILDELFNINDLENNVLIDLLNNI